MREPAISVVIPVYNVEAYLKECLDSVLAQTETNIEIICVNDGSTDGSRTILEDYSKLDERIRIIDKENEGLSSARNSGLDAANGEYLYYLDSDDKIRSDMLSACREVSDREQLDVLVFDGVTIYENEEVRMKKPWGNGYLTQTEKYDGVMSGLELFTRMSRNHKFRTSVMLQFARKEFLIKNDLRFAEGILFEDADYTFRLFFLAGKMMHIPEGFFIRRYREGSIITSGISAKAFYGRLYSIRTIRDLMVNYSITSEALEGVAFTVRERQAAFVREYNKATGDQQAAFKAMLNDQEALDFALLIESCAAERKKNKELRLAIKEKENLISAIENSRSYKFARALSGKYQALRRI